MEVPAGGGEPKVLTTPDTSKGEGDHLFPEILPGGRAVLFTTTPVTEAVENSQIAVYEFDTKRYTTVVRGGSSAQYVALRDGGGLLVYTASNTLRAVRFDPVALKVIGDPVLAADHVSMAITGAGQFALAENGTLAHLPASPTDGGLSLAWVDRQGAEHSLPRRFAPIRPCVCLPTHPEIGRAHV